MPTDNLNCPLFTIFVFLGMVSKNSKDIKKVQELLAGSKTKGKFDARKFCGVLKVNEDGLVIQQRLRGEWT